jgi:hypothetical protein
MTPTAAQLIACTPWCDVYIRLRPRLREPQLMRLVELLQYLRSWGAALQ